MKNIFYNTKLSFMEWLVRVVNALCLNCWLLVPAESETRRPYNQLEEFN